MIADTIRIEPGDFRKTSAQAVQDNINEKYANKVIPNIGLCISFFDLLEASDGLIGHGTGNIHVNVKFRLLVFRPFRGEILEGTIDGSDATSIKISLGFFDEIYIPAPTGVMQPAAFNAAEKVWVWQHPDSEYYYDHNERVRFRVEEEIWRDATDESSAPPRWVNGVLETGGGPNGKEKEKNVEGGGAVVKVVEEGDVHGLGDGSQGLAVQSAPWRILGSMDGEGLGQISWWTFD